MKVRICPTCGTQNLSDIWVCNNCGEVMSEETITDIEDLRSPPNKTCSNCRTENVSEAKYCKNCGRSLSTASSSPSGHEFPIVYSREPITTADTEKDNIGSPKCYLCDRLAINQCKIDGKFCCLNHNIGGFCKGCYDHAVIYNLWC